MSPKLKQNRKIMGKKSENDMKVQIKGWSNLCLFLIFYIAAVLCVSTIIETF